MFIGVLLIITWLVLLLRYPAKALPVSLAAVLGLAIVAPRWRSWTAVRRHNWHVWNCASSMTLANARPTDRCN